MSRRRPWAAIVEALEAEGVEYVFGLPGNPDASVQRPLRQLRAPRARADGDVLRVHGDGLRPRFGARGCRAREPGARNGEPRAGAAGGAVRLLAPRLRRLRRGPRPRGRRWIPGHTVSRHGQAGHEVGGANRPAGADGMDDAARVRGGAERQAGPRLRRDPRRRGGGGSGDPALPAPVDRPPQRRRRGGRRRRPRGSSPRPSGR